MSTIQLSVLRPVEGKPVRWEPDSEDSDHPLSESAKKIFRAEELITAATQFFRENPSCTKISVSGRERDLSAPKIIAAFQSYQNTMFGEGEAGKRVYLHPRKDIFEDQNDKAWKVVFFKSP